MNHKTEGRATRTPHKTSVNTVAPVRFMIGFKVIFLILNKMINSDSPQFHHNQLIDCLLLCVCCSLLTESYEDKNPLFKHNYSCKESNWYWCVTTCLSGAPQLPVIPDLFWGSCCPIISFMCKVFSFFLLAIVFTVLFWLSASDYAFKLHTNSL